MSDNETRKARALGINHLVLEVDDLDQALEFYGSFLEVSLRGKSDHNAFIDLGDQFIQLTLGRTQVADTKRHFGLVVDDRPGPCPDLGRARRHDPLQRPREPQDACHGGQAKAAVTQGRARKRCAWAP